MKDEEKTKEELVSEIESLREQIRTMNGSGEDRKEKEEITTRTKIEEELRSSEERCSKAFHSSPCLMAISALSDWRCVDVNESFVNITGYSRDEVMGRRLPIVTVADQTRMFNMLMTEGSFRSLENRFTRKTGEDRWGVFSAEIISIQGEKSLLLVVDDITDRKRIEEALQESEEKYRELVENANSIVLRMDEKGAIIFFNEYAQRFFGFEDQDVRGRNAVGTIFPHTEAAGRDFRDMIEEIYRNPENHLTSERESMLRNGEQVWISWTAKAIRDRSKNVTEILWIGNDITERRRFQKRLVESEERYRTSIESSNDGVAIVKGDKHLYVNKRFVEIFGYDSVEEVVGQPVTFIVHPDDRERVAKTNRMRQAGGAVPSRYEFKGVKKNGDVLNIEVSAALTTYGGEPISLVYLRDITERRSLEAQLLQAQKMEAVGQLAGGVAHDFNNILTAIIGYGGLLKMKMKEDDPLRVYTEHILASAQKATHLTQNLLAFSRKQMLNPEPANLNDIVVGVRSILRRTIGEEIELRTVCSRENLTVMSDIVQLEQVLINLAINARDAMPGGGTLTISTKLVQMDASVIDKHNLRSPGTYACITVTDTGIGMDEKTKARIFEPFFTTKEAGKGTGLGLSTVYGIVSQHNGFIRVQSKPGEGATFEICLPLTRVQAEDRGKRETTPLVGGTEVILLGEDDPTVRLLSRQLLEEAGYTVIEAADGEDVIAKFNENRNRVDLLMLDVIMPRKNGREAYEAVKAIRPDIRVLFMSGYSDDIIDRRRILQENLNFIEKPVSPRALLDKVREVLG
ncbi:MAG: Blue-light-activated protein [Syntrophorhabdus sp. PtaU1.Bin050]|nr:MAG: Blue-light-activated protein [Syntrophorhabdus sp. PtaU1.Bin050]